MLPFDGTPIAICGKIRVESFAIDATPTHIVEFTRWENIREKKACIVVFVENEDEAKDKVHSAAYGTAFCWKDDYRFQYYVRHFPRFKSEMPGGFVNFHSSILPPQSFAAERIELLRDGNIVG